MRILFLGDIVGRTGRNAVIERLPGLRERWRLDAVVINGENAAGGFGLTEAIHDEVMGAGADAVTLGNHAFDQREALVFIERAPRLVRPANLPRGTPGRGATLVETKAGGRLLVVQVMGRVFMDAIDDPFTALERELDACPLGRGRRRRAGRRPCRGDQREAGPRPSRRRPGEPRRRHPHPCPDGRPPDPGARHRLHVRCRHVRRL